MNKRARGTTGENLAAGALLKKGFHILHRNFRFERGEIDIVADDHGVLVFVEVKARRSKEFGRPEDAVTAEKQEQIRKVAEGYLLTNEIYDRECRFDVVAIEWNGNHPTIEHIKNAF